MDIDIPFGVELWWLLTTMETANLGENDPQQPALIQQIQSSNPMRIGQDLHQLIPNSFCADGSNLRCIFHNGSPSSSLDLELQSSGKANCSHQPQVIFCKTLARVSNGPHQSCFQVRLTADKINHFVL